MSAKRFYDILKMIKFKDIEELDPSSFEWIVEENSEFFEWLCNTVDERNVLTPEEVARKEALDAEVKGTDLSNLSLDDEDVVSGGASAAAAKSNFLNANYNIEQIKIQRQMEALNVMQDVTRNHYLDNNMEKKLEDAQLMHRYETSQVESALNENAVVNQEMAQAVEKLKSIIKLLEEGLKKCELDADSNRFIHSHINDILSKEENYTRTLENYLKLQFPADLSSDSLDENVPLATKSVDEMQLRAEAELLHSNLTSAHNQWLTAAQINAIESARQTGLKLITKSLEDGKFPSGSTLREKIRVGRKKLDEIKAKIGPLQEKANALISQLSKALAESVFTDGYELKCARQSYFLEKMDKVIEQLVHQNANLELFSWLCTIEHTLLNDINDCFENLHKHLQLENSDSKKRMDSMENLLDIYPKLTSKTEFQSYCKTLSEKQSCELNSTKKITGRFGFNIVNYLAQLKSEEIKLNENMKSKSKNQIQNLDEMNQSVHNLQHAIWRDSPSFNTIPSLYPKSVLDGINKMSYDIERDERFITAIEEDYKTKQNQLEYDDSLRLHRQLFTDFYNNEKLKLI